MLNVEELRSRLLMLADERLANRPFDLAALRAELSSGYGEATGSCHMWNMRLSILSQGVGATLAAAIGAPDGFDRDLIKMIDDWAARQEPPQIEALPPKGRDGELANRSRAQLIQTSPDESRHMSPKVAGRVIDGKAGPSQPMASAASKDSAQRASQGVTTHGRTRGWWASTGPFIQATWRQGRHTTCKDLYKALEDSADSEGSPFAKGVGRNRGVLIVRATKKPLSLKTMQNNMALIRDTGHEP